MTKSFDERAEAICTACGARCCHEAHPPLSPERIALLMAQGVPSSAFECQGYTRLRSDEDGMCILCSDGMCRVHTVKPETCVAGPFTFDVQDHTMRLFIKREAMCPLAAYLKRDRGAYEAQLRRAILHLSALVRSLSHNELAVINGIPEPETELIATVPLDLDGVELP